jgi:hypothetical protein
MSDSHTTATPETTNAAPTAHPPVRQNQRVVEAEVEQGAIAGQRVMRAVGGGSPEAPPDRFAGALGQMQSASGQAGMLRQLQRSYGNSYVGSVIQAKLTVNQPGDSYEQEADRMAAQVMAMPQSGSIQREMDPKKEKEKIQMMAMPAPQSDRPIQREMDPKKEKEKIQMLPLLQRATEGSQEAGANLEGRLNNSKGGGSPLSDDVRSFMEPRFGTDFSQVRAHTDSEAVQMNRDLNAQAFTHRQDVYFGAGKAPAKDALTAHELTHVMQQTGEVQAKNSDPVLTQRKPQSSQFGNNFSDITHLRNNSINSFSVGSPSIQRGPGPDDNKKDAYGVLHRLGRFGISFGEDGLVYLYLDSFTLVEGRKYPQEVPIVDVKVDTPPIPLPIEGLTATAGFNVKISSNVDYTLKPVKLTNIRLGVTKEVASTVLGIPDFSSPTSILLNLSPAVWGIRTTTLINSLQLSLLTGKPPFWLTYAKGTAGIETGGSAKAYIKFEASGNASLNLVSKKLSLLELAAGVTGAIGAELGADSKVDVLGMTVDSGHMTFKQRRELNLRAGVFASLSAFLEAKVLAGLFKKRFNVNWAREETPISISLVTPKGAIDVDFDNGIKDEKKLIELDGEDIKKAFAIYEAIKTLFTTTEAEGKVKGDEQEEVEEKKEKENSLIDKRDVDQKKGDLRLAIIDSEALLTTPNLTPEDVLAQLPTIKRTYRLTAIKLLRPSINNDEYVIEAEINPKLATDPPRKLKSGKTSEDVREEIREKLRSPLFKPGPNAHESVAASRTDFVTAPEQREVNRIGNLRGCHHTYAMTPGSGQAEWTGDHQPATQLVERANQNSELLKLMKELDLPTNLSNQRLYPHSVAAFKSQGGTITAIINKLSKLERLKGGGE